MGCVFSWPLTPPTANRFLPLNSAISHRCQAKNRSPKIALFDARRDPKLDAANSQAQIWPERHSYQPSAFAASVLLWALAENSAQTDQVKRKSAQRKQHYLRAKTDLLWGA